VKLEDGPPPAVSIWLQRFPKRSKLSDRPHFGNAEEPHLFADASRRSGS